MRYILILILGFSFGCGAAEPVDEYTQEDAETSCADKNAKMAVVIGCHICAPLQSELCGYDDSVSEERYYWRAFDDGGQWTCRATPVAYEDRETVRAEQCE